MSPRGGVNAVTMLVPHDGAEQQLHAVVTLGSIQKQAWMLPKQAALMQGNIESGSRPEDLTRRYVQNKQWDTAAYGSGMVN